MKRRIRQDIVWTTMSMMRRTRMMAMSGSRALNLVQHRGLSPAIYISRSRWMTSRERRGFSSKVQTLFNPSWPSRTNDLFSSHFLMLFVLLFFLPLQCAFRAGHSYTFVHLNGHQSCSSPPSADSHQAPRISSQSQVRVSTIAATLHLPSFSMIAFS